MNVKRIPFKALLVGALLLAAAGTGIPALADGPTDGRVNLSPWVNSYGAVAVYCIDASGVPASSFSGGGIEVLDGNGQPVFFASEAQISDVGAAPAEPTLIHAQGLYSLVRMPDGTFQLYSRPDAEGKTLLGTWSTDCGAIAP
jgi:hypothetical protein